MPETSNPAASGTAAAERTARRAADGTKPLRHGLVWLVFGIPAATVVAGVFTIWIAYTQADRPIAEQYEKRGLAVSAPETGKSVPVQGGAR